MELVGWVCMALLIVLVVGLVVLAPINRLYKNYVFDKEMGSYCDLAYSSSDIHTKIDYFDRCVLLINKENFSGHVAWWFKKPNNHVGELNVVTNSLQLRMHNLKSMEKDSFEYQKGLEQVEEEMEYFQNNTLRLFSRAYCFRNTWTKYLC
jgi:hypothetical protein